MNTKHKENPADIEAGRWLSEQKELSGRRRLSDRLLLISVSLLLIIFGVAIFLLPSEDFSEDENRMLADFPEFSLETLVSGEFTEGIADFYSDRFPLRNLFVGLKATAERLMGKGENNGIIEGDDGYIIERFDYSDADYETLTANLTAIEIFKKYASDKGCDVTVALAPRAVDVMTSKLPPLYGSERDEAAWATAAGICPDALTFTELLRSRADGGEQVWYKTDHHYTTLGAYYVYCALGESLGYEPYPIDFFTVEVSSEDFLGTTYSSSGMKWTKSEKIELFRYPGDGEYSVSWSGGELSGFYDESYLDKKDKYSVFLGGNHALTSVKGSGEKPTLLLIKDSYSHALTPFLALHFDVELVDLRLYSSSAAKLIDEMAPDKILVYYGLDTLVTSPEIERIRMGAR